jgi:hypothetical protein
MELAEAIRAYEQSRGRQIVLAPPPECLFLVERARQDGIALRFLYVLSEPLDPLLGGESDPLSRDVWIYLRSAQQGGLHKTMRTLLHELAHLEKFSHESHVADIDEDWDEEARVWERAYQLARRWGVEEVFPEEVLQQLLAHNESMREDHWYAAWLAGTRHPQLSRLAYAALCQRAGERDWTFEQLSEAMQGASADDGANATVADFDRCLLRSRWRYAVGYGRGSFGSLACAPDNESARLLRNALFSLAQRSTPPVPPDWMDMGSGKHRLGFLVVEEAEQFTRLLGLVQALLLDHPDLYGTAYWHVYGQVEGNAPLPRLYHLAVTYSPDCQAVERERETSPALPEVQLWILFPSRLAVVNHLIEPAWQRYILSWIKTTALRCEELEDGITLLLHALMR